LYAVLKCGAIFVGLSSLFYFLGRSVLGWRQHAAPSTALAAGLVLNLLCAMLTGQIVGGLVVAGMTAVASGALARYWGATTADASPDTAGDQAQGIRFLIGLGVIASCFLILCLVEPIKDWDARSIWFYHAKVIYHTKSIWAGGAWATEANIYTHLNYPKLFSLLAAQVATLLGFWNEYAPKLAITLLALPMLAFYCEAWQRLCSKYDTDKGVGWIYVGMLTLLLFGFDGSGFFLFNGYMDGWVALYACLATIAWVTSGNLWQVFVFLCLVAEIKQEGLILAGIVSTIGIALQAPRVRALLHSQGKFVMLRHAGKGALLIVPIFAWFIAVKVQHLARSHYSGNTFERALARLSTPSDWEWIVANILLHNAMVLPSLALATVLTLVIIRQRRGQPIILLLPLLTAVGYIAVVFCVYLATNADLYWHLGASAGRVGLSIALLLATFNFLAIYCLFCNKRSA